MKRLWVPVLLLALLIGLCTAGLMTTKSVTHDMDAVLTQAKEAAENGDNARALELSQRAAAEWGGYHKKLCTFLPHNRLESIETNVAALPPLIQQDSKDQFLSECERCLAQIRYLQETEIPSLENLL